MDGFVVVLILAAFGVFFWMTKKKAAQQLPADGLPGKNVLSCPDCGGMVSKSAKKCPHCGAKQPGPMITKGGWLFLIFVAFFVYSFNKSSTEREEREAARAAMTPEQIAQEKARAQEEAIKTAKRDVLTNSVFYCKKTITAGLKAPSTAEFQDDYRISVKKIIGETDAFIVNGYVDAQNSFGAKLRNNFECKTKLDGAAMRVLSAKLIQ